MNISLGVCLMLILTSMAAITTADTYDPQAGPNYMGFTESTKHVIVGSQFYSYIYGDIHSEINTIAIDNMTYLPAGIITNSQLTVALSKGTIFNDDYTLTFARATDIHDSAGWIKFWIWAIDAPGATPCVNNTNATAFNTRWNAVGCGIVTLTITEGGTANSTDPGTTKYPQIVYVHPMAITGFTAVKDGSNEIDLSWTKHTGDDKTLIRWRSDTYPTSVTDGTLLYNGTDSSTSQSGLSPGDTRYYSAWGWNDTGDIYSQTYVTAYAMTNRVPLLGTPTPTNNSINQPRSLSWNIPITDPDGDSVSWTLECSNGQSNFGAGGGGTKALSLGSLSYSTTYKVWVNASDASSTTRAWYQFTTLDNIAPAQGTPSPTNGSTGRPFAFTWSIPLSDGNGDLMDWTIQCSNGQSSNANGASNGTKSLALTGLAKITWYTVWVNVTDGVATTNRWYRFQTMDNLPPAFGTPTPANNSVDRALAFTWSIGMTDADLDTISWTIQCSNGQSNSGAGSSGLTATLSLSGLAYSTTYRVYVNATDAGGSGTYTRRWYQFTTVANQRPSIPTTIVPADDEEDVEPDIGHLRVVVSDPDGHMMTVRFYWGNDTLIGTDAGVVSGQFADISIDDLLENTEYEWYVNISDGYGGYRRGPAAGTWVFTTGEYSQGMPHQSGADHNDVLIAVLAGYTPVPGAIITINQGSSVQTMGVEVRTAATGPNGIYNFNLPNGNYVVTVTAPGYDAYQAAFTVSGDTSNVVYLEQAGSGGGFPWWVLIVGLLSCFLVLFLYSTGRLGHKRKY